MSDDLPRPTGPPSPASAAGFEALYQAELPRIYNYFRYRLGDGPEAEDLTAETFEKAWRHRGRYRLDLAAFSTWLFTIARRVAADHYRRSRRAAMRSPDEGSRESDLIEGNVERRLDLAHLSALLSELSERERELIALKYGGGLTHPVIAALTGLSQSNVGVILYRSVEKLRHQWEKTPWTTNS